MEARILSMSDYASMVRRRIWWIILPAVIGPVIGFGVCRYLPKRYTSQTVVLVQGQKVPESFVKSVVTEDIGARLATMQEQILSRSRLQPIIERFGLYSGGELGMEQKVDLMRQAITVTPMKNQIPTRNAGNEVTGFTVTFTASKPKLAQQVCAEITALFMQENLLERQRTSQGTTDFLSGQLEDAKKQLDAQDARLATFKKRYMGQLPDEAQSNLNMLNGLNGQLQVASQNLYRMQQDKTYTEAMLNQQTEAWEASQTTDTNPQTLDQQLASLEAQLITLQGRYTPSHPDVIKTKKDIAAIRQRIKDLGNAPAPVEPKKDSRTVVLPQQLQQLKAQLHTLNQSIQDNLRDQDRLKKAIQQYESRVEMSPMIEEELKDVTRDYQTALDFYNDLLRKKNQSEMATSLEREQQGEQFNILDPANLPDKPSFPDPVLFAAAGLAAGLLVGLGMMALLEVREQVIRTESDVEHYLRLPVLGRIPSYDAVLEEEPKRRFWRRKGGQLAVAAVATQQRSQA